jgi:flagellar motor switch protein FliN/FliY
MDKNDLVSGFLGVFSRAITEALAATGPEDLRLEWNPNASADDNPQSWTWWSAGLSTHPGANCFIGAPEETWEKLGQGGESKDSAARASALISDCFAKAVEKQFEGRAAAQDSGPSGAPSGEWTRIYLDIRCSTGKWPAAACVLSPEFEQALQEPKSPVAPFPAATSPVAGRSKSGDMLMLVQVPVSVSFGATQIRMQDLLNLTAGSVVELDQALQDTVEVRVNDRVIAFGEVVAVDGHYGVRVLELVSGENGKGMRA